MSIVLDNLGPELEAQLEARAAELRESPADLVARLVRIALGPRLEGEELRRHVLSLPAKRDLSKYVGRWEAEPEFDAAMAWQDELDKASMEEFGK